MKKRDAEWKDQKYCRDCKKKTLPCQTCGVEVPYYYLRNARCGECNQRFMNSTYTWKTCTDCGRQFEITVKDHEFYEKKGWSEPSRCQECRDKRKSNNGTSGNRGGLFGWLFN